MCSANSREILCTGYLEFIILYQFWVLNVEYLKAPKTLFYEKDKSGSQVLKNVY